MRRIDRAFVVAWRLSQWSRLRFTAAGRGLATLGVAAGIFGLDTSRTAGAQIFAVCASALAAAWWSSRRTRSTPRAERALPARAVVGRPVEYTIALTAPPAAEPEAWRIVDRLDAPFPTRADARAGAGDRADNFFDRRVGYPRWAAQVDMARGGVIDAVDVDRAAGAATVRTTVRFTPLRRGRLRFGAVLLLRPEPLGLMCAVAEQALVSTLVVRPARWPVPALRRARGAADDRSAFDAAAREAGDRPDFRLLRAWRPSDPVKRIHWPASARVGVPLVREFERDADARRALHLAIDAEPGAAFETAVGVALSIAAADAQVDAVWVGAGRHPLRGARRVDLDHALDAIAIAQPGRDADSAAFAGLREVVHVLPRLRPDAIACIEALAARGVRQAVLCCDAQGDWPLARVPCQRVDPHAAAAALARWDGRTA
jgi:uncharacterized protein (DUF58 family)